MINAQGTEPGKYALSIFDILTKARDVTDTLTSDIDLDPYSGNYDNYAWGGEDVILPWKGKLAIFSVPSANPAKAMQLFKNVGKDNFRRVRKDDNTLGEELRFERDSNGKVVRLLHNDNFDNRLK